MEKKSASRKKSVKKFRTTDEYLSALPPALKQRMRTIRGIIASALPGGEESISYNIPVMRIDGSPMLYFACWKEHIALYPLPRGSATFNATAARYKGSKSSVHFPHGSPLPERFIRQCAKYRLEAHQKRKKNQ